MFLSAHAQACARRLATLLADALTDRLSALPLVFPVSPALCKGGSEGAQAGELLSWPAAAGPVLTPTCLWVCLRLDPMHAARIVDREPPLALPQAASAVPPGVTASGRSGPPGPGPAAAVTGKGRSGLSFVDLWGAGLAEQRRFADGSVCSAVVWDAGVWRTSAQAVCAAIELTARAPSLPLSPS